MRREVTSSGSFSSKISVECEPSKTAMGAAALRALAALETREEIRGRDHLAEIFLSEEYKLSLKDPAIREWVMKNRIAPGMYEFMIARTAFFDSIVERALREDIPRIAFLGAGYDSRHYRFRSLIQNTRIFELDIETTQQRKRELLRQAKVDVPDSVALVSINFNSDNVGDVLKRSGFNRGEVALFVWEGVTYYLSERVVDETLGIVRSNAAAGSRIGFDYASRSPENRNDEGLKRLKGMMEAHYPGEPTRFAIERGKIEWYLSSRGYRIVEHLDAREMELKYLSLRDGSTSGKAPASLCLCLASVADHGGR